MGRSARSLAGPFGRFFRGVPEQDELAAFDQLTLFDHAVSYRVRLDRGQQYSFTRAGFEEMRDVENPGRLPFSNRVGPIIGAAFGQHDGSIDPGKPLHLTGARIQTPNRSLLPRMTSEQRFSLFRLVFLDVDQSILSPIQVIRVANPRVGVREPGAAGIITIV